MLEELPHLVEVSSSAEVEVRILSISELTLFIILQKW